MAWIKKYPVRKSSQDGYWTVALSDTGQWGCSCPVWKFRRRECKHIALIRSSTPAGNDPETRLESSIEYLEAVANRIVSKKGAKRLSAHVQLARRYIDQARAYKTVLDLKGEGRKGKEIGLRAEKAAEKMRQAIGLKTLAKDHEPSQRRNENGTSEGSIPAP